MAPSNNVFWRLIAALSLLALVFQNLFSLQDCQMSVEMSRIEQMEVLVPPSGISTATARAGNATLPFPWINFVHIGKNGGSTIELIGRSHDYQCGIWGSRMVAQKNADPKQAHWMAPIKYHNVDGTTQELAMRNKASQGTKKVYEWHVPPAWLAEVSRRKEMYRHPDTFCTIRHPISRLISAYYYQHLVPTQIKDPTTTKGFRRVYIKGPCFDDSAKEANRIINKTLHIILENDPCHQSCHYLPQAHFLADDRTLGSGLRDPNYRPGLAKNPLKQCNRIIVLELNLTKQFNELMQDIGCPIQVPVVKRSNAHVARCSEDPDMYEGGKSNPMFNKTYHQISRDDLSPEVMELVRKVYAEDIEMYEYYANKLKEQEKTTEQV